MEGGLLLLEANTLALCRDTSFLLFLFSKERKIARVDAVFSFLQSTDKLGTQPA